jgi:hypothetical protein
MPGRLMVDIHGAAVKIGHLIDTCWDPTKMKRSETI